jgi:hypothetical protein
VLMPTCNAPKRPTTASSACAMLAPVADVERMEEAAVANPRRHLLAGARRPI